MSYTIIERKELTEPASGVIFENIPQTFTDLILFVSSRTDGGGPDCLIRPNGSSSNLSGTRVRGNGVNILSSTETTLYVENCVSTDTASTFSNNSVYFSNYSSDSFKNVSIDATRENRAIDARVAIFNGLWSDTSPITSINILPNIAVNFVAGSSFSLYGINRKQSIGRSPQALGGAITYANGYWVHTFNGSGTFMPFNDLSVEYLVIGGGGGAGIAHGGGGAGGYRSSVIGEFSGGLASPESKLSLTALQNYTVTIGAGGAGYAVGSRGNGGQGGNSSFASITSTGGGGGGDASAAGISGGSGGGNGYINTTFPNNGTANQGFSGGSSSGNIAPNYPSGGGGGAGSIGQSTLSPSDNGGDGGAGLVSSITGVSVGRAGGGAGGNYANVAGGVAGFGGGNAGTPSNKNGSNGSANTGGGGGSSISSDTSTANSGSSGAGGSGIVIIRYPG